MKFSMHDIEQLHKQGKIRGFTKPPNSSQIAKSKNQRAFKELSKRSKEKEWLSWNLPYWCNEHTVSMEIEYAFHPARKWRFDYAIPSLKIAIEYEGIFSEKSRHTTFKGYNADTDKYNAAAAMGWRVIRLTAKNYTNVLKILNEMIS